MNLGRAFIGFLSLLLFAALAAPAAQGIPPDYEAMGKILVQEFSAGQYDKVEAQFNQQVAAKLPVQALPAVWKSVAAKYGSFERINGASAVPYGQFHIVTVSCQFEKAPLDIRISYDSDNKVAGLFFLPAESSPVWIVPSYANPNSFHEQPVTVGKTPWTLPGTLTLPNGKGPFPAVVLVQGSGPHDEDETIGPNKPFKDLAWGLASHGIAVLRYEKRTAKYGAQIAHPGFTVKQETTDDAQAAVSLLAKQPEINPKRIYVLGHSQGGMLAPRIAEGDPQIAGIILMAGSTEHLAEAAVRQTKYIVSLHGKPTPDEEKTIEALQAEDLQINSPTLKAADTVKFLGINIPASYFLDLRSYNPAATAAKLKIPILILQGGRDYNVTVPDDFDVWKKALANNPRVEFKFYPTLDHLFMTGSQPPSPQDGFKPGHVSAQVVGDIAQWVEK